MWDSKLYDAKHAFVWKHGAALIDLLDPKPGESVLDLGCGTGHLTAQIAARGTDVFGVDASAAMIEQARRAYPNLTFEVADIRALPFVGRFDAVFSNAVLHWVKEAEQAVAAFARALQPDGRFVAEFGGRGNVGRILAALQAACRDMMGLAVESPWYYPSVAEYAGVLEAAGLEVTYATLFDRPTPLEGEAGLRHWIDMFGGHFLATVPAAQHHEFSRRVEEQLRPALYREGVWFADYRRLRVVAVKRHALVSDAS